MVKNKFKIFTAIICFTFSSVFAGLETGYVNSQSHVGYAARELVRYLYHASGEKVPVFHDKVPSGNGFLFV